MPTPSSFSKCKQQQKTDEKNPQKTQLYLLSPPSSMLMEEMSTSDMRLRLVSKRRPWLVLNNCATIEVFSFLLPSQISWSKWEKISECLVNKFRSAFSMLHSQKAGNNNQRFTTLTRNTHHTKSILYFNAPWAWWRCRRPWLWHCWWPWPRGSTTARRGSRGSARGRCGSSQCCTPRSPERENRVEKMAEHLE